MSTTSSMSAQDIINIIALILGVLAVPVAMLQGWGVFKAGGKDGKTEDHVKSYGDVIGRLALFEVFIVAVWTIASIIAAIIRNMLGV